MMEGNPKKGNSSRSMWSYLGVLFVAIEIYTVSHSMILGSIAIAIVACTVTSYACAKLWARTALDLANILNAPVLKISPCLSKIILAHPNKIIPYARVEGQVKAINQPIKSMYVDGITGVMQKLIRREYKWKDRKSQWCETQKAPKTVPFVLTSGTASIKVVGALKAVGLELTTFYDKFCPTKTSFLRDILNWFFGREAKGFQNVELMLQQDKTLTGIGELRISNNNDIILQPPSDGKIFVLAISHAILDVTNELKRRIRKWKWLTVAPCVLGGLNVFGLLLKSHNLYYFLCIILIFPLLCIKLWYYYKSVIRKNALKAFSKTVKSIQDEDSMSTPSNETTPKEDDDSSCVVCMSEPRDCVLLDCGHICVCKTCAHELHPFQCPLCRKTIIDVQLIYHA